MGADKNPPAGFKVGTKVVLHGFIGLKSEDFNYRVVELRTWFPDTARWSVKTACGTRAIVPQANMTLKSVFAARRERARQMAEWDAPGTTIIRKGTRYGNHASRGIQLQEI